MIRATDISLAYLALCLVWITLCPTDLSGQTYAATLDSLEQIESIQSKISYLDEQVKGNAFIDFPDTIAQLHLIKSKLLFRNNISIQRAIQALDDGLSYIDQFDHAETWLELWYYKGYWFRKWDKYKEAKHAINKVLSHPIDHHLAWEATIQLGKIYKDRGDFTLALKTYDEAIILAGEDRARLASTYEVISFVYLIMESVEGAESAIPWLQKLINLIIDTPGEEHFAAIMTYNLATAYMTLEDYNKAEFYLDASQSAIDACCEDDDFKSLVLESRGIILAEQGEYEKALLSYEQALELYEESFDLTRSDGLASTFHQIASIYHEMGDLEQAMTYIDKSLGYRLAGIDSGISCADISEERLRSNGEKHYLIDELITKAKIIIDESAMLNAPDILDHAMMTLEHCDIVVDHMRKEQIDDNSKLFWRDKTEEIYDLLIYVSYELGDYVKAFHYAEKSKYLLLGEHLAETHPGLVEEVSVPSKLLEDYVILENEMDKATLSLNRMGEKLEKPKVDSVQRIINTILKEKDDLISMLQAEYPDFYTANFTLPIATIEEIREQLLSQEDNLVAFHLSDSILYSYVITQDTFVVSKCNNAGGLPSQLRALKSITEDKDRHSDLLLEKYASLAHGVYKALFEPISSLVGENLIIVQDPHLSIFPTAILLSDEVDVQNQKNLRLWPYLVKSKTIRHFYSASLALQMNRGNSFNSNYRSVLACRPSYGEDIAYQGDDDFDNVRSGLAPLYGSRVELDFLKSNIKGKYLEDGLVNKTNLLKHLVQPYSIIHIASHAILDNQNPEKSKLILSQQGADEGALYAYEIERAEVKSNLVVLSACNTGYGKLEKGEGLNSLGLAFAKAGSPNLLTSLWSVSDRATGILMTKFYNSLLNNYSIANSIRRAQLEFLDTQPVAFTHPYYWGGFVYYGNGGSINIERQVTSKREVNWWLGILLLPLCWIFRKEVRLLF